MRKLALLVGAWAMFSGVTAAPAVAATKSTYTTGLLRAVGTCQSRVTPETTFPQFGSCTRDLAAPQQNNVAQLNIFNIVQDCLWLGWTPGRGDGGFDNDTVNDCLEDQGVL